jgi:hypothetical protein
MVWVVSKANGNVFEVHDVDLARYLEVGGDHVHDTDPRIQKAVTPKPVKGN